MVRMVVIATDLCLNLNGYQLCYVGLIFFKIRPSLNTSEEGLESITYFRKQRGFTLQSSPIRILPVPLIF